MMSGGVAPTLRKQSETPHAGVMVVVMALQPEGSNHNDTPGILATAGAIRTPTCPTNMSHAMAATPPPPRSCKHTLCMQAP